MLYTIIFEAEVIVNVEANSKESAKQQARTAFKRTDVQIIGVIDVECETCPDCGGSGYVPSHDGIGGEFCGCNAE